MDTGLSIDHTREGSPRGSAFLPGKAGRPGFLRNIGRPGLWAWPAALVLAFLPALAGAAPGKPGKPAAMSGDGTMVVSWDASEGATGGYEYRYSGNVVDLLAGSGPGWTRHGGSAGETSVTLPEGTLTVGGTYFFQVRGVSGPERGPVSDPSDGEIQRAAPSRPSNVQAAGNSGKVTLSWDAPDAGELVLNHDYRQDGGSGWGKWRSTGPGGNSSNPGYS